ncbi:glycoside-pentoside-hexuronide (GPH):cation symporter [Propionicimonas sp.]|uniref:glycoside-pentoside-hexuronide (GPH):cation symporter n=1 Tax=Propionicimonas sp. TaxID=1955623 RepID=UPI00185519C5|nr:glycoside-pentoside-hexuronide (GPH):cation symporter [Propionicimonas sp.]MBU3977876.1 glycoside-pentoside-hexuronide (GPH):cation symporter [Actinomycetota bacterium]MBA3021901.1 MFS transporter [Propionicimonas sp.]MBU3987653.1 glycoside-pentoside-hexuronide (GPH):cation symporter [Actinomycetota bacterium]MBU4007375.1 glycoside-pentoside-hexuronide (GPH):cation symporter [Actinomycetota bacterium]MBU4065679.1 glycoside-pentoside-hexuronide (GPH):cation symporter [Actinomycetota bacteriu
MPDLNRRNKWTFGVGTVGRDMVYGLVSIYLVVFLTEAMELTDQQLWTVSALVLGARLIDAFLDVGMGGIVDNTRTRWGHYKPWILVGALSSAVFTVLLFTDLQLSGGAWVAVFAIIYLGWSLSWTANDIPYWSMLPALTLDQKEREKYGSLAKVFATIGLFAVVVAVIPVTGALTPIFGPVGAWTVFAAAVVVVLLLGQAVTLFGVREPAIVVESERTSMRELLRAVFGNDQLLWTAVSMVLFMTGYVTTTSFGVYFFKYVYGDEGMYAPFAAVLGVGQLLGFAVFPAVSKLAPRRRLYGIATAVILVGYVIFFFSPMNMIWIGISGLLMFFGQSFVVLLMLVFLTDTIEYGQWKLGRRNGSVTFAVQPFINKVGGALATWIVSVAAIISGINTAQSPADMTPQGLLTIKIFMLVLPPILIVIGYVVYRAKYRIDEAFHAEMVAELKDRGQVL